MPNMVCNARGVSARSGSTIARHSDGMSSTATHTNVAPGCLGAQSSVVTPQNAALPTFTARPSTVPAMPAPATTFTSVTSSARLPPPATSSPTHPTASFTTAAASGCVDLASSDAASRRASFPAGPPVATTRQRPCVSVPVLSAHTIDTWASASRADAALTSMPRRAPAPMDATAGTGAASTSAHGHATTSSTSARCKENKSATSIAATSTPGVKYAANSWSTSCVRVDEAWASSTSRRSSAAASSARVAETLTLTKPFVATVPPETDSPLALWTGSGSPVSADSSIAALPETTTPSQGTRSPARTMTTSPTIKESASTTVPSPLVALTCAPSLADASASAFRTRRKHSASAKRAKAATAPTVAASPVSFSASAPRTAQSISAFTSSRFWSHAPRTASRARGTAPPTATTTRRLGMT
mmetsp:Transcript_15347/g.40505  ORF Transcript_15347/g.40505 Transcript_15347/m.40505 type:complete len:417 (-) Transcript_15347:463-1713(-)